MRLYKHIKTSEVVELVGVGHNDIIFRWPGWEFKEAFFSIDRADFRKNYVKIPKKSLPSEVSPVSSRSSNNF